MIPPDELPAWRTVVSGDREAIARTFDPDMLSTSAFATRHDGYLHRDQPPSRSLADSMRRHLREDLKKAIDKRMAPEE